MAMQSLDDDSGVHVGCYFEHGRQVYSSAVIRPAMTYAAAAWEARQTECSSKVIFRRPDAIAF